MSPENLTPNPENLTQNQKIPIPNIENPTLKLDAQGVLDFIDAQTRREREYFDRLLDRFVKMASALLIAVTAVVGFFGYQNWQAVRKVEAEIREDTKRQLSAAVSEELTKEKVGEQITKALQQRTDTEFQEAINRAIASELNKPERQKILETALKHVTKHLQQREDVASLGDRAISGSADSGRAFRELLKLWKNSPDDSIRDAARAEIARVRSFWGSSSYLGPWYQITTLNGKPAKESDLTTCDLLAALRSGDWKVRARSALLLGRPEKGVPEALMHAMTDDDYLEVAEKANLSLSAIAGGAQYFGDLPDQVELQTWWAKEGPNITARLKPSPCANK